MDGASGETQSFVSELNLASRPMHNQSDVHASAVANLVHINTAQELNQTTSMLRSQLLPMSVLGSGSRYSPTQDQTNIHVATLTPYEDQTNMLC